MNKVLVRIFAVVALPLASLMFVLVLTESLGLLSIEVRGSPDDPAPSPEARAGAAAPGEAVHAAGAAGVLIIIASGLIVLLIRPERAGSAYQVLAASGGMVATTGIVGNPDNFGGQAGPLDPAFLVLAAPAIVAGVAARPWRAQPEEKVPRRLLIGLSVFAAIPAAYYGIEQGLIQRNTYPPAADPHHQAHWYAMSVAGFVTVLVVAVAATARKGWRVSAASGGFAAIMVGATSIISSEAASSLRLVWGPAALLWGAFVLAVVWRGSDRLDI
jgi:hypothetical protein